MGDIINSIKAYLYDKAVSPLFGAFAVSWSVWNYEVILILFSSMDVATKLSMVGEHYKPIISGNPWWSLQLDGYILHSILLPIVGVIFYIFIFPFLSEPVYRHHLNKQKKLKNLKQQMEDSILLTVSESRELRSKHTKLQAAYEEDIESSRQTVSEMNTAIEESVAQTNELTEKYERLKAGRKQKWPTDKCQVFAAFASAVEGRPKSRSNVSKELMIAESMVESLINELEDEGLLRYISTAGETSYELTEEGWAAFGQ